MQVPPLTEDKERRDLHGQPVIAAIATRDADGDSLRITPLWFDARGDGEFVFNTFENSDLIRNLRANGTASVLIDTVDQRPLGVHYRGRAEVVRETQPEDAAEFFARYTGGYESALEYTKGLHQAATRVEVRFVSDERKSWDFREG